MLTPNNVANPEIGTLQFDSVVYSVLEHSKWNTHSVIPMG